MDGKYCKWNNDYFFSIVSTLCSSFSIYLARKLDKIKKEVEKTKFENKEVRKGEVAEKDY